MNHAQRIRAAVERAREAAAERAVALRERNMRGHSEAWDRFGLAMTALEQIAIELEQGWTRESNYVERAETEGELHEPQDGAA